MKSRDLNILFRDNTIIAFPTKTSYAVEKYTKMSTYHTKNKHFYLPPSRRYIKYSINRTSNWQNTNGNTFTIHLLPNRQKQTQGYTHVSSYNHVTQPRTRLTSPCPKVQLTLTLPIMPCKRTDRQTFQCTVLHTHDPGPRCVAHYMFHNKPQHYTLHCSSK